MMEKLRPLADRVLVKRAEDETMTKGGIIIPDAAKEKPQAGTVLAVGAGRLDKDGNRIPVAVKAGDVVYFGKFSGIEADEEYVVLREDEIIGVLER